MTGYVGPIDDLTLQNTNFRQVLFTGKHTQLVVMSLKVGEEIGSEVHPEVDQFFRIEKGIGEVEMDGVKTPFKDGDCFIVPAGTTHNVVNTGPEDLKLYTLYSPPNHPEGTIHATKADTEAAEAAKNGKPVMTEAAVPTSVFPAVSDMPQPTTVATAAEPIVPIAPTGSASPVAPVAEQKL